LPHQAVQAEALARTSAVASISGYRVSAHNTTPLLHLKPAMIVTVSPRTPSRPPSYPLSISPTLPVELWRSSCVTLLTFCEWVSLSPSPIVLFVPDSSFGGLPLTHDALVPYPRSTCLKLQGLRQRASVGLPDSSAPPATPIRWTLVP
jgi:hypothetical protein